MNRYTTVFELDVLKKFNDIEIIGQHYIPKSLVAQVLKTSLYQVNKCCKTLIEKEYLRTERVEPFHEIEYETGIDYGNNLSIWITEITDKGIEKLKQENLYTEKWYETEFDEVEE